MLSVIWVIVSGRNHAEILRLKNNYCNQCNLCIFLSQPFRDVLGPIGENDIRPRAADGGEGFEGDGLFVDPAAGGGGFNHAEFARHVVGRQGHPIASGTQSPSTERTIGGRRRRLAVFRLRACRGTAAGKSTAPTLSRRRAAFRAANGTCPDNTDASATGANAPSSPPPRGAGRR